MALDRSFALRMLETTPMSRLNRQRLRGLGSALANRPILLYRDKCLSDPRVESELFWPLLQRLGGQNVALFIPPLDTDDLMSTFEQCWSSGGNIYQSLHRSGCLVISPTRVIDDGVVLSGGSYSSVTLSVKNGEAVVRKLIHKRLGDGNVDADLRLWHEAHWLGVLPKPAATLFPQVRRLFDKPEEFGYEMEFVPLPTVGELIFQDCLNGDQVFGILRRVYSSLRTNMYCHPSIRLVGLPNETGYLGRIERRTKAILESTYPADGILRALYSARWVEVNGTRCPSQAALIQQLHSEPEWQPVVEPCGNQLCAGDLILEDILVSLGNPREFRLVDPNPANRSALFDVAKTMLSLWIGYEFVYYDLFSIDECTIRSDGGIEATITLARPDCQSKYAWAASRFLDFVKRELSEYLGLESRRFESQLRMASALHALAIPMFHLLHHGRESRAFVLACLGLYHASLALAGCPFEGRGGDFPDRLSGIGGTNDKIMT